MEWISVKDRLPEENKKVLFFNGETIWCGYKKDGEYHFEDSWICCYGPRQDDYKYWMSLPEMPK